MTPDGTAFTTLLVVLLALAILAANPPECPDAGCRRAHRAHQPEDE